MEALAHHCLRSPDDAERLLEQRPIERGELAWIDIVGWLLAALELLELHAQAEAEQKLEGLRQILSELRLDRAELTESDQARERIRLLDSVLEREEADQVDDRSRTTQFEVELVLVLAAPLDDEASKKTHRRG